MEETASARDLCDVTRADLLPSGSVLRCWDTQGSLQHPQTITDHTPAVTLRYCTVTRGIVQSKLDTALGVWYSAHVLSSVSFQTNAGLAGHVKLQVQYRRAGTYTETNVHITVTVVKWSEITLQCIS